MLFTKALNREQHKESRSFKVHSQSLILTFQKLIYLYFFQSEETGKKEEGKRLNRARVRNGVEIWLTLWSKHILLQ